MELEIKMTDPVTTVIPSERTVQGTDLGEPSPRLCPLCARDNECAVANQRDAAQCWCMTATFPPQLLEQNRDSAGQRCICVQCLNAFDITTVPRP
ncbi:cysteine-rich CWC family protein [Oceanobacter sp. 4_MG-2023]|uniref:cysteine-rich CWC family protein n=1 Tax=unclassified Oceanobacter TaxID=2620260 RepID=UPI00351E4E06